VFQSVKPYKKFVLGGRIGKSKIENQNAKIQIKMQKGGKESRVKRKLDPEPWLGQTGRV
jgi:hypothetical protein